MPALGSPWLAWARIEDARGTCHQTRQQINLCRNSSDRQTRIECSPVRCHRLCGTRGDRIRSVSAATRRQRKAYRLAQMPNFLLPIKLAKAPAASWPKPTFNVELSVSHLARHQMPIMLAKVAMNGGTVSLEIVKPLTVPMIIDAVMPDRNGNRDVAGEAEAGGPFHQQLCQYTAQNARMLLTLRSMPPVRMTKVMANAITPTTVICLSTSLRFPAERKMFEPSCERGLRMAASNTIPMRPAELRIVFKTQLQAPSGRHASLPAFRVVDPRALEQDRWTAGRELVCVRFYMAGSCVAMTPPLCCIREIDRGPAGRAAESDHRP